MKIKSITRDELIGQQVFISKCSDPTWIDISGVIVDETKHTFLIETKEKVKRIAKEIATFSFDVLGTSKHVQGSNLRYRPEERVKKAR
jgi:ribonuclease P protein subunit POP4